MLGEVHLPCGCEFCCCKMHVCTQLPFSVWPSASVTSWPTLACGPKGLWNLRYFCFINIHRIALKWKWTFSTFPVAAKCTFVDIQTNTDLQMDTHTFQAFICVCHHFRCPWRSKVLPSGWLTDFRWCLRLLSAVALSWLQIFLPKDPILQK